jgi:hypothetical protein
VSRPASSSEGGKSNFSEKYEIANIEKYEAMAPDHFSSLKTVVENS